MLPPLPEARPGELRECYYNLAERGTCSLLATNTSQQECCCTLGEGWGMGCLYHTCPPTDTGETHRKLRIYFFKEPIVVCVPTLKVRSQTNQLTDVLTDVRCAK